MGTSKKPKRGGGYEANPIWALSQIEKTLKELGKPLKSTERKDLMDLLESDYFKAIIKISLKDYNTIIAYHSPLEYFYYTLGFSAYQSIIAKEFLRTLGIKIEEIKQNLKMPLELAGFSIFYSFDDKLLEKMHLLIPQVLRVYIKGVVEVYRRPYMGVIAKTKNTRCWSIVNKAIEEYNEATVNKIKEKLDETLTSP